MLKKLEVRVQKKYFTLGPVWRREVRRISLDRNGFFQWLYPALSGKGFPEALSIYKFIGIEVSKAIMEESVPRPGEDRFSS